VTGGERAIEARQVGDEVLLRRRGGEDRHRRDEDEKEGSGSGHWSVGDALLVWQVKGSCVCWYRWARFLKSVVGPRQRQPMDEEWIGGSLTNLV
jgi:hypothetical protein